MQAIYRPRGAAYEYAPLACNLFAGCTHGCRYCYAPACLRMQPEVFWAGSKSRDGIVTQLGKDAAKLPVDAPPVLFCFTSDPYQPDDNLRRVTASALSAMQHAGRRFDVLTKGGTRALPDIDLFRTRGLGRFGTTLLFTRDTTRRQWEPNAASVEDRMDAIRRFHEAGVYTWVSTEPVIDPVQAVEVIQVTAPYVDEFRVGKLNHHPLAKQIDWFAFARDVAAVLEDCGRDYMVKDALRPFLPKGFPVTRYAQAAKVEDRPLEANGQFAF